MGEGRGERAGGREELVIGSLIGDWKKALEKKNHN